MVHFGKYNILSGDRKRLELPMNDNRGKVIPVLFFLEPAYLYVIH